MILVTVGSTQFPFQRMATLVEHVAHSLVKRERIIFQYGATPPHFVDRTVMSYPFIPHTSLMRHMRDARVILCHGGPATIYQALSFGKIPWVLPRQHRYGEHLNDHQMDFSVFMQRHNLVRVIIPDTDIRDLISSKSSIRPVFRDNTKLIACLDDFIHSS